MINQRDWLLICLLHWTIISDIFFWMGGGFELIFVNGYTIEKLIVYEIATFLFLYKRSEYI
ncbi:MAG: hypothetical protein N2746_06675 [Deltaproteobacteria bacterium]|nr:hypothetical protein [Deltaproteobacteria bacterium]